MQCPLCNEKTLLTTCTNTTFGRDGKIYQCQNCKSCMVLPLPSDKTLTNYYEKEWSNDHPSIPTYLVPISRIISSAHMNIKNDFRWPFLKPYLSTDIRILEIGAGEGSLSLYLKKKGFHISVVEPSQTFQRQLTQKGISVIGSNLEDINVKEPFDLCLSFHVLEHLNNPLVILKKIRSLLKPKGLFLGEVPNVPLTPDHLSAAEKETVFNNVHLFHYSCLGLDHLFKKAAFSKVDCIEIGFGTSWTRTLFPKANFNFIHPSFKVSRWIKYPSLFHAVESTFRRGSTVVQKGRGELGYQEPNDFIFFWSSA